jgi:hypothetical protein
MTMDPKIPQPPTAAKRRDRYTEDAYRAILAAARTEHDFAGWLARVLADVSGQLGSHYTLVQGRPGSWEASHITGLMQGTVGADDEYLPPPRHKLTDDKARAIRDRCRYYEGTRAEIAADFGVSESTVSDITSGRTWRWLA